MNTVTDSVHNLLNTIARWLPQLLGALLILLVGYLVAKTIERLLHGGLRRAKFDAVLHKGTAGSYIERVVPSPSGLAGSIAFWLVWLATLSLAVTVLGVPALTGFVDAIYGYLPNVFAALLIFIVAGAVSTAAAGVVTKLMGDTPTGKVVATVVPVLTMLIATFMILNQLQIAPAIVTITYAALMGAVALGMALAFGLGGQDVAGKLLAQAYEAGKQNVGQVKRDMAVGRQQGVHELQKRDMPAHPLEDRSVDAA